MEYLTDFRPEFSADEYSFDRKIFTDEKTDRKVHKHLQDEKDEITDEDLENIKTEMTPATEAEEKEAARKEGFSEDEVEVIDEN